MTEACNCISTLEAELPEHKLDIAIMWSQRSNTLTARTYTRLNRRDNDKAESRSGKPRLVAHTFCPFCGVRHDPGQAEAASEGEKA